MSKITTVGIDLAKNVFSIHGVDERGAVVVRRTVRPATMTATRRRASFLVRASANHRLFWSARTRC